MRQKVTFLGPISYRCMTFADCGLQTADCRLQTADCRLQTSDCRPQIADCRLQTADCRLQTADCRLQTADCMRQQDCKLNETKNIVIKVASSPALPCSEKYMEGLEAKFIFFTQITPTSFLFKLLAVLLVLN